MGKVRHVLGISGGKDSAALAIYMKQRYPHLPIEYYTCDTGKELPETYELIDRLEEYLGRPIIKLSGAKDSVHNPFDHYLETYGGFLPSSQARWCTKKLKLEPFESFVGSDPVVSYVGIRGDEERDGYISKKPNIQSIFPFRKNIWSQDVIDYVLANSRVSEVLALAEANPVNDRFLELASRLTTPSFSQAQKLALLLDVDTVALNTIVFELIKQTTYPLALEDDFALVGNTEVLVKKDIFNLLVESGVGIPDYYTEKPYEVAGKQGTYARSRSGCFFCFFQQKIEWVWLYEQHPDRFAEAVQYEKDGFTWGQEESLLDLIKPERIQQIKEDYLKRQERNKKKNQSGLLLDLLEDGEGCAACFV